MVCNFFSATAGNQVNPSAPAAAAAAKAVGATSRNKEPQEPPTTSREGISKRSMGGPSEPEGQCTSA